MRLAVRMEFTPKRRVSEHATQPFAEARLDSGARAEEHADLAT